MGSKNGLRIGVIGAGHLGKIHARLLKTQKEANLVFVADPSPGAQQAVIDEPEVYAEIGPVSACDAAAISVMTP